MNYEIFRNFLIFLSFQKSVTDTHPFTTSPAKIEPKIRSSDIDNDPAYDSGKKWNCTPRNSDQLSEEFNGPLISSGFDHVGHCASIRGFSNLLKIREVAEAYLKFTDGKGYLFI